MTWADGSWLCPQAPTSSSQDAVEVPPGFMIESGGWPLNLDRTVRTMSDIKTTGTSVHARQPIIEPTRDAISITRRGTPRTIRFRFQAIESLEPLSLENLSSPPEHWFIV